MIRTKAEALELGYIPVGHQAYSSMLAHLQDLLREGKLQEAKKQAAHYEKHPLYWYRKGTQAVAVEEE